MNITLTIKELQTLTQGAGHKEVDHLKRTIDEMREAHKRRKVSLETFKWDVELLEMQVGRLQNTIKNFTEYFLERGYVQEEIDQFAKGLDLGLEPDPDPEYEKVNAPVDWGDDTPVDPTLCEDPFYNSTGWRVPPTDWEGGENPLGENIHVRIQLRDGTVTETLAGEVFWEHEGNGFGYEIVKYAVY